MACIHDTLLPCGDQLCPSGAICMADRCVSSEAIMACDGRLDATVCSTSQIPAGVCVAGACLTPGCGNGIIESVEACDDGNTIGGDGCSADCMAVDRCPTIGITPKFSVAIREQLAQPCGQYSAGTDWAIATCSDGFYQGPVAGPLTRFTALSLGTQARIAPEGDELFALEPGSPPHIWAYRRDMTDNTWSRAYEVTTPFALDSFPAIGAPTSRPARHMLVSIGGVGLQEIMFDAGPATVVRTITEAELGIGYGAGVADLTPDGLRMTVTLDNGVIRNYYTDRPSLGAAFRTRDELQFITQISDPFMTRDCSRLYFSALSTVLYVEQQ